MGQTPSDSQSVFPEQKSAKRQQWMRQPRAIPVTHKRKQRGGRRVRCAHGEKTQRFPASSSDRQRPPANKSDAAKRQDAQKGVWGGGCPELWAAEREETCRECASRCRRTQRNRERRAWPNLARLMKNGQESAYLAHPSLSSTTAPPHILIPPTSAPLLPPLHPPHLPSGSRLYPLFDLRYILSTHLPLRNEDVTGCVGPDTILTREQHSRNPAWLFLRWLKAASKYKSLALPLMGRISLQLWIYLTSCQNRCVTNHLKMGALLA